MSEAQSLTEDRVVPISSAPSFVAVSEASSNESWAAATAASVRSTLTVNAHLVATVVLNFLRDFCWTVLAAFGVDVLFRATADVPVSSPAMTGPFRQQLLGQQLWASLIMAAGVVIVKGLCKATGSSGVGMKEMLTIFIAAAVAIVLWNCGCALGTYIGSSIGVSPTLAGLIIAPLFTGLFEGTVQYLVRFTAKFMKENSQAFKDNPAATTKKFFQQLFTKELALNMTIGAIPGAMWQVIFFSAFTMGGMNPWAVGALVAVGVALCNIICSKIIDKMMEEKEKHRKEDAMRDQERLNLTENPIQHMT